jgi:hypothetical protein
VATQEASRYDKILNRVQALLAKAASTEFPDEADALRAKADELMTSYAIDEYELERKPGHVGMRPTHEPIDMRWYWEITDTDVAQSVYGVFWGLASHVRIEIAYMDTDYVKRTTPLVGMAHDIAYFKLVFTDVFRQMIDTMDPHPRPNEPLIEALVRMKEAGMKWEDIFKRLKRYGYYPADLPWNPGKMNYAGKYTDYCIAHRRPRIRTTPSVYKRSFTQSFAWGLSDKLDKMRAEQGQNTGSRALALRDYRQDVTDALYEFFPKHKPQPISQAVPQSKRRGRGAAPRPRAYSSEASERGLQAGRNVTIIGRGDNSRQGPQGELT